MAVSVHVFTDPNLQNEFQCKICMGIISQCYSTQCGHLFCSKCILSLLSPRQHSSSSEDTTTTDDDGDVIHIKMNKKHKCHKQGQCPVCLKILQIGDIFPAPYVDKKILSQIVRCIYFHKGCLWTGTLTQLNKKENGHLKHCGYALYTCKYCKDKVVGNQMVQHQNESCKSNYMLCPYYMYGCSFECRIREMEKHCQLNELKHLKLKLDYLENQLLIPEIIELSGMSGKNKQYIESNGRYYLSNKNKKESNNINKPIMFKKNGGYTLQLNQSEQIWQLKSLFYGLIAYGMPKSINNHHHNNRRSHSHSQTQNLDDLIWSVYYEPGVKSSLMVDGNVKIESVHVSDGMMDKYDLKNETDTEEINGEENMAYFENYNNVAGEGMMNDRYHHKSGSWLKIIFGGDSSFALKKKKVIKKRLELIGIVALSGVIVYYLWSRFGRSHPAPAMTILTQNSGKKRSILLPNFM